MAAVPAGAKVPADRKKKTKDEAPDEAFSFEHDGKTYTFKPTLEHLTPGFVRRNRDNETEFYFGLLEMVADEDTLELLDNMSFKDNTRVMREFSEHSDAVLRVSLGE